MKKLPSHFVREFIRPLKLDNCFVCVSDQLVKHFGVSFCRESYTINLYDNSHDKVNGIKIYTILFNYELREKCSFKKYCRPSKAGYWFNKNQWNRSYWLKRKTL